MTLMVSEKATCVRQRVGEAVQERLDEMRSSSRLPIANKGTTPRDLPWSTVHEQTTIGVGAFCSVHQVHIQRSNLDDDDHDNSELAMKCLKTCVMKSQESSFVSAASDLAIEGELLSRLSHPNIIKLHGVSEGGPLKAFPENSKGYFLVLDLLHDTLKNRLEKCRRRGGGGGVLSFRQRPSLEITATPAVIGRVKNIAIGVASGLSYLHKNNVVLRDLKPDNIGFDLRGTPKIFDLGFARELHTIPKLEVAGTIRYLAPEVALGEGYETAADVYSFGVLLWEICTTEKPFSKYKTPRAFMDNVVNGNYRPPLSTIQSPILRELIQDCWDRDPSLRPSMSEVLSVLRICVTTHPRSRQYSSPVIESFSSENTEIETIAAELLEKCPLSQSFSGPFKLGSSEGGSSFTEEGATFFKLPLSLNEHTNHTSDTGSDDSSSHRQKQLLFCDFDKKKTFVRTKSLSQSLLRSISKGKGSWRSAGKGAAAFAASCTELASAINQTYTKR